MESSSQEQQSQQGQVSLLNRRVESQGNIGTVLFEGGLVHEGRPAGSESQQWLGIEWDDKSRGKHNGVVNGHEYFVTSNGENSGSLVKLEKVTTGIPVLEGIFKKYFRDNIPAEMKENIIQRLKNPDIDQQVQKNQNKENAKLSNGLVETDEEAYFETLRGEKKVVEFYGFEKIWSKLNNMRELTEISLYCVNISDLGPKGYLRSLLPNLRIFSLEKNLLFNWNQIFQIGLELEHLEELQISSNRLVGLEEFVEDIKSIAYLSDGSVEQQSPKGVFKTLKTLNLIDMNLNWRQISRILGAFANLESLILCRNILVDYENIELRENLKTLKFLNVENTCLSDFSGLKVFGDLPQLEKLILNQNNLTSIGKFNNFRNITSLSLEGNPISNPQILTEISQFPELTYLNIKHIPITEVYGKSYVRQRSVAENPKLNVINGAILKKYERKDCEIFYLRKTFDEYFKLFNKVYYDYDFEDFKQWAYPLHPRIESLIKVYGNPYEVEKNKKENNMESESVQKNIMLQLTIVIAGGPLLGKDNLTKKFPDNTTVSTLKNVFSKLLQIPSDRQVLYFKVNPQDSREKFDEDHKSLNFYGIKDSSEIIVDQLD